MKLRSPHQPSTMEPVIVLVDVVFFLLVFFMLVSRMDATAPFEVMPPIAVSGTDMPAGGVTISVAEDGRLALDGRPLPREDWLAEVRDAARGQSTLIRINAHAETDLRHVLPILSMLEREALGQVMLVVTPGTE
jgi:biopolymer transport protein ExbD